MYFISLFTVVIMWVHIWLFEHATSHRNFVDFPGALSLLCENRPPPKKKNNEAKHTISIMCGGFQLQSHELQTNFIIYITYVHIVFWYIFFFVCGFVFYGVFAAVISCLWIFFVKVTFYMKFEQTFKVEAHQKDAVKTVIWSSMF